MYFSRIRVDTDGLDHQKLVRLYRGDGYAAHQLLWHLFDVGEKNSNQRTFLFRQELEKQQLGAEHAPRGLPLFYLMSETKPVSVPGLLQVEAKPFSPRFVSGMQLAFHLRANPVVSRKAEGKKNSQRHDVLMDVKKGLDPKARKTAWPRMEQAAKEWLVNPKRLEGLGCHIDENALLVSRYWQHSIYKPSGKRKIQFSSVDYEGILTIQDPEKFLTLLCSGIGRERAFGCGLLLVRPT